MADRRLGWVIPGDVIYEQIRTNMLESGELLREMDELIGAQDDGTEDGRLRARICRLICLIANKLPKEGAYATGMRAVASAGASWSSSERPCSGLSGVPTRSR